MILSSARHFSDRYLLTDQGLLVLYKVKAAELCRS